MPSGTEEQASKVESNCVATGCSYGALAKTEYAKIAVLNAINKLPSSHRVSGVLLFLSAGYAHAPQEAIKAAVLAAGTPMVHGACSTSLMTEDEWLMDVEGAVAMVFTQQLGLVPYSLTQRSAEQHSTEHLPDQHSSRPATHSLGCLCLSSPNAVQMAIAAVDDAQFGAVVSDLYGHGPYSLWQSGRIVEQEYVHTSIISEDQSVTTVIARAEGIRPLCKALRINESSRNSLLKVDNKNPIQSLKENLSDDHYQLCLRAPFNLVAAVSESIGPSGLDHGNYRLLHLVEIDTDANRVKLSDFVPEGHFVFWAIRDPEYAHKVMDESLKKAKLELAGKPKFALMFPNLSRGPEFYAEQDGDLELFRQYFPKLPMLGFYSHAEIAPNPQSSTLIHHYSTTFAIVA